MTCRRFYGKMQVTCDQLVINVRKNKIFEERTVFLPVTCGSIFAQHVVVFTEIRSDLRSAGYSCP